MLSTTKRSCVEINVTPNCAYYTTETCVECNSGYRANRRLVPHFVD